MSASGRSYGGSSAASANQHDADAITYPDDIIHDSYGNIVKPYKPLPDQTGPSAAGGGGGAAPSAAYTSAADIGLFTDVNKDNNKPHRSSSAQTAGGIQFALPSYADGILPSPPSSAIKPPATGILPPPLQELLPPLSSGNYNYPQLTTGAGAHQGAVGPSSSSPQAFDSQNEVNSPFAAAGGNKASPSGAAAHQQPKQATTVASISIRTDAFNQPNPIQIPTQQLNAPAVSSPTNTNSYFKPPTASTSSNVLPKATSAPPAYNNNPFGGTIQSPASPSTGGKYTGGFGGAPGVLGNQPNIGYAVTTTAAVAPISAATVAPPHQQQNKPGQSSSSSGAPSAIPSIHFGTSLPSSQSHGGNFNNNAPSSPSHSAAPSSSGGNDGKYTGGFGGPPGHLTPYDKPLTAAAGTSSSNVEG